MASFGSGIGVGIGWRDSHAASVFKNLTIRNNDNTSNRRNANISMPNLQILDTIKGYFGDNDK